MRILSKRSKYKFISKEAIPNNNGTITEITIIRSTYNTDLDVIREIHVDVYPDGHKVLVRSLNRLYSKSNGELLTTIDDLAESNYKVIHNEFVIATYDRDKLISLETAQPKLHFEYTSFKHHIAIGEDRYIVTTIISPDNSDLTHEYTTLVYKNIKDSSPTLDFTEQIW